MVARYSVIICYPVPRAPAPYNALHLWSGGEGNSVPAGKPGLPYSWGIKIRGPGLEGLGALEPKMVKYDQESHGTHTQEWVSSHQGLVILGSRWVTDTKTHSPNDHLWWVWIWLALKLSLEVWSLRQWKQGQSHELEPASWGTVARQYSVEGRNYWNCHRYLQLWVTKMQ
jgi:hypothetical protein